MKEAKDLIIPFSWQERHPILLERFFYVPSPYEHQEKHFCFFEEEKPIVIEYCSGNGQWIAQRAKQVPQVNWLAVEKRFDRARKIWLKSFKQNLKNLCTICSEGVIFTRYYAPKVQEVFINFPDPWPKRRHAAHRLVRKIFLEALAKIVVPGGTVTCVTDDDSYANQILKEFENDLSWKLRFHSHEWPDYGSSFFHELWIKAGRTIHYLSFEKL